MGLPAAAALIRLLRGHHAEPERIRGGKFLALRFPGPQWSPGLSIGLAMGSLVWCRPSWEAPERMRLSLALRPYGFALSRPLTTASGSWQQRDGWLLRMVCPTDGACGLGRGGSRAASGAPGL